MSRLRPSVLFVAILLTVVVGCGPSTPPVAVSPAQFIAGDGVTDDQFFTDAGAAGDGSYASVPTADPGRLATAAAFVADYKARFSADAGTYSAGAYDAMNILLRAIRAVLVDNGGSVPSGSPAGLRRAVALKVAKTSYDGALGHTSFDSHGDTTNILLTIEMGQQKKWVYADTVRTVLSGTVSSPPSPATPSSGPQPLDGCQGSITVATDLPTSGTDASDGIPTQNGAQLAVEQANSNKLLGGCRAQLISMNDASVALQQHDPDLGARNMAQLVANPQVLGVVGPLDTSVAVKEIPIANPANLTLISPANTNPGLTIAGADPSIDTAALQPTGTITYFRVCTTDIGQGKALADYAYFHLGVSHAYVVDNGDSYGMGLANQFIKYFTAHGGQILKRVTILPGAKDFSPTVRDAKSRGADVLFYGGTSGDGGGLLRKAMVDLGLGASSD